MQCIRIPQPLPHGTRVDPGIVSRTLTLMDRDGSRALIVALNPNLELWIPQHKARAPIRLCF